MLPDICISFYLCSCFFLSCFIWAQFPTFLPPFGIIPHIYQHIYDTVMSFSFTPPPPSVSFGLSPPPCLFRCEFFTPADRCGGANRLHFHTHPLSSARLSGDTVRIRSPRGLPATISQPSAIEGQRQSFGLLWAGGPVEGFDSVKLVSSA